MSKSKKESFFWTSYSDLMTSLFFVMLVLFVLVIVLLHNKMLGIEKLKSISDAQLDTITKLQKVTQNQLDKIIEIQNATENIDNEFFQYDAVFKRHTLKNVEVKFITNEDIFVEGTEKDKLIKAGRAIFNFMSKAKKELPDAKYILILEGQSSKDDFPGNDVLSYKRALAVYNFWNSNGIVLDKLDNCEVIVSGSGQSSSFRVEPDIPGNKENQRLVIHIIPKPGIIKK